MYQLDKLFHCHWYFTYNHKKASLRFNVIIVSLSVCKLNVNSVSFSVFRFNVIIRAIGFEMVMTDIFHGFMN